ncbi:MAG: hypothetical protein IPK92_07345 [Nitrospira sp.]|nr:hypothetical protein [Nitrospira sp.]
MRPKICLALPKSGDVRSWLLDLTAAVLMENLGLSNFTGAVQDSGEGRWTVMVAIEEGVRADVLSAVALHEIPLAPRPFVCREGARRYARPSRRPRQTTIQWLACMIYDW